MFAGNSLTYDELRHYLVKAKRNGVWFRLSKIERGFYSACVIFAKVKAITSPKLVSMLSGIIEKIKPPKLKAIEIGKKKAEELARLKIGFFIFPLEWLKDETFIEYLGFLEINARGCYA
ncbi:MAG: hypothetical protein QXO16_04685 [Archaeoglobaceae archaeon]